MPKENSRSRRVAELIKRELAVIIQNETQDTIKGLITISTVDISPDLKNANVYITYLGENQDTNEIVSFLNERAGEFRHQLAGEISLRTTPKLIFLFDKSLERANRISALIDSLGLQNNPGKE